MITPTEIKAQCLKWWREILIASLKSTPVFPKEIARIGKVTSKDILNNLRAYNQSIQLLQSESKENKKYGYKIIWQEKQFDKIGRQQLPGKIIIESREDYLRLTGKVKEFENFEKNHLLIMRDLPQLEEWIHSNPTKLIEHDTWHDTLKVCKYFIRNPKPKVYIRQLPIEIHTKYVSENESIIQSLLEFLIPNAINLDEKKFEKRFNLKYPEPLIRIRFLDKKLIPMDSAADLSLTLSGFNEFHCACRRIFVVENIMNFLTLPDLSDTISIWSGGGFNIGYLKEIDWIKNKQFYYWGDIDAQGFQILSQFRSYFPNTVAVLMDEETLSSFTAGKGRPASNQVLQNLTESEKLLYEYLRTHNIRLEQEKITQAFAERKIAGYFEVERNKT